LPASDEETTGEFAHSCAYAFIGCSDCRILDNPRLDDPEALLEDLHKRNAQDFSRRPQDLIELCADLEIK
jgi:hypothetical protein